MQEVYISGAIDQHEPDGVSAKGVRNDLAKLDKRQPLLARINSPGGSVFEAVAINTMLADWPGGVDVQIDGLAASAASYLACVGRHVAIAPDAMVMIHECWGVTVGNADDHRSNGKTLDQISEVIAGAYVRKTGKSKAEVWAAMKSETWFNAEQAIEFGLADSVIGERRQSIAARRRKLGELRVAAGVY